jgi:hypothetical protein
MEDSVGAAIPNFIPITQGNVTQTQTADITA